MKNKANKKTTKTKRPMFIVVEGGDGAGKSSIVEAIKRELGDRVVTTREPGGSKYAEVIRNVALKDENASMAPASTMMCLMFAARYDHIKNLINPALQSGKHVITDRFDASTYAYQIHAQGGKSLEELFWNLRAEIRRLPDIYIYADVEVKEGLRRVQSRTKEGGDKNHFDDRKVEFHKRLRGGYKAFFRKIKGESKIIVINANKPKDEVISDLIGKLKELI